MKSKNLIIKELDNLEELEPQEHLICRDSNGRLKKGYVFISIEKGYVVSNYWFKNKELIYKNVRK